MFEAEVAIKAEGGRKKRVRNISTRRISLPIIYEAVRKMINGEIHGSSSQPRI
jgi:hypothetical protein